MRMEELSNSRYVKGTDTVERYLLGLVEQYFKDGTVAMNTSREFIIKQAVKRMKEELDFEDIGVLSITLPDGRVLTGPVTITIDDLGGEPKIDVKGSAFNVDFGDQQNTACEGNDPRLSDARNPLPHQHSADDIVGLNGMLSTLTGSIKRVNGLAHEHDNKDILDRIVYTGTKSVIDIGAVDTSVKAVQQLAADVKKLINEYKNSVPSAAQGTVDAVQETSQKLDDIKSAITLNNSSCLQQAKQYAQDEFSKVTSQFNASTGGGGYVVKDKLDNVLKNAITDTGSMSISVSSLNANNPIEQTLSSNISDNIQDLNDCQFEFRFKHKNANGSYILSPMPYMVISNSQAIGQIVPSYYSDVNGSIKVVISFESFVPNASVSLADSYVTLNVYTKQGVTL